MDKQGANVGLSWTPSANGSVYDVVTGSLSALRASAGNFALSTTGCTVDDAAGTTTLSADPAPPPGGGTFFLLRSVGAGCRGTYDEGTSSQQGLRDAGILAAASACP
jgi:hypothetical protein